jgi:hypothetical protein
MDDLVPNSITDKALAKRRKLKTARRDDAGFSLESLPHLSTQQVKWLASRAGSGSNAEACAQSGVELFLALEWMEDPEFVAMYQEVMENKREGFKQLATQALPLALTTLLQVMSSGEKDADRIKAATLILRNQGLLMDRMQVVDKDAISYLLEEIRKPRPVITVLPSPKRADYINAEAKEIE